MYKASIIFANAHQPITFVIKPCLETIREQVSQLDIHFEIKKIVLVFFTDFSTIQLGSYSMEDIEADDFRQEIYQRNDVLQISQCEG